MESIFIELETFDLTTTATLMTCNVNVENDIYLKFEITYADEPSGTSWLIIDDIVVYGKKDN